MIAHNYWCKDDCEFLRWSDQSIVQFRLQTLASDHSVDCAESGGVYSATNSSSSSSELVSPHDNCRARTSALSSIPKAIHFIWIGGPMPRHLCDIVNRWREIHDTETWQIHVWTDENMPCIQFCKDLFHFVDNPGTRSDILRYEILYQFGGWYFDVDYECIRSLDYLYDRAILGCNGQLSCDFVACLSHTAAVEVNNGAIGCSPGHRVTRSILHSISETAKPIFMNPILNLQTARCMPNVAAAQYLEDTRRLSIQWTIRHTGPGALTTCLDSIYVSRVPSVVGGDETWDSTHSPLILPKEYFHSIPNTVRVDLKDEGPEAAVRRKQLLDAFCRNEVCIAVHWWQQSWQSNKTT